MRNVSETGEPLAKHMDGLKSPTDAFTMITAYKHHVHTYPHHITMLMFRKDKRIAEKHTVGIHTLGSPTAKLTFSTASRQSPLRTFKEPCKKAKNTLKGPSGAIFPVLSALQVTPA